MNQPPRPLPTGMEALGAVLDERFGNLAASNAEVAAELRALRVEIVASKAESLAVRTELALLTAQVLKQNGNVANIDAWRAEQEQEWREHKSEVKIQHVAVDAAVDQVAAAGDENTKRLDNIEGVEHDNTIRSTVWRQVLTLVLKGAAAGAGAAVPILGVLRFMGVI